VPDCEPQFIACSYGNRHGIPMFKLLALLSGSILVASCVAGSATPTLRSQSIPAREIVRSGAVANSNEAALAESTPSDLVPSTDAVMGQWDVVRFEDYQPPRLSETGRATSVDFGENGVALRIECNYSGRAGTIRGGHFITSDENGGLQTAMSCGPERDAREARFFSFFEKAPTVEYHGPDQLRMRAGATELILARPSVRRLNFIPTADELQGRWRLLQVTQYFSEGGFSSIGLSEVPGRIVISGDQLFYSRCPQYRVAIRLTAKGNLEKVGGSTPPAEPTGCKELSAAAPGRLPAQWDAILLLHASPNLEKSGEEALLISNNHFGLLLTKAP
jgi:heat shock protein HslJ